jgi:maleate cis-trans isomerase
MSRYLLVVMHEDLALLDPARERFPTTHDGVLISCKNVNGVESVTDLGAISQETLDQILMQPTPGVAC